MTEHRETVRQRLGRLGRVDTVGAVLIVIGCVGVAAWMWTLVRSQFDIGDPGSLLFGGDGASVNDRLDALVSQVPLLLFAALVGGLGVVLRVLPGARPAGEAGSEVGVFGRPFGRVFLGAAGALALLVGVAALVDDDGDRDGFDFGRARDDIGKDVDAVDDVAVTTTTLAAPPAPTHTLEVHTDGCGVIRSGEIGDDLTWVVKDQDGFQVLGRNAAGETQYRYFQPGAYTVVLEGWGGDYYVEVSNEVTINC